MFTNKYNIKQVIVSESIPKIKKYFLLMKKKGKMV